MEFRSLHVVETADNVPIHLELAGLANRVFAFGIDTLVMLTIMGFALLGAGLPSLLKMNGEISKTLVPVAMFLVFFGYHLLQEWLWNGRTVGKICLGIRVVRDNGQPIGFWESLGRNLMRVFDVYVMGLGFLCMLVMPNEKRFGDLMAGTLVINDQSVRRRIRTTAEAGERSDDASVRLPGLRTLTSEEAELIRAYRSRRDGLLATARQDIGDQLCHYFSARLQQSVTTDAELDLLLEHYHRIM